MTFWLILTGIAIVALPFALFGLNAILKKLFVEIYENSISNRNELAHHISKEKLEILKEVNENTQLLVLPLKEFDRRLEGIENALDSIQDQISDLKRYQGSPKPPNAVKTPVKRKKRHFNSAAQRKAASERMKKKWAEYRASQKAEGEDYSPPPN